MTTQTLSSLIFARHKSPCWIIWPCANHSHFYCPMTYLFSPADCSSKGFIRGSHCCSFSKGLSSTDKLTWINCKNNNALFSFHSSSNSTWSLKENALFRLQMPWKCLLVAQGSLLLSPLPTLSSVWAVSAQPAVIIPSLDMDSELYMMLQISQSPGHWTHLDYQDATIWMPQALGCF